ncbi:hypothetical protein VTP01DRAFT_7779 [Rhizomucor pusillus]|uniref:uncharacterized protein n=1 Tax=Rhizomucor pusillus TaxID=4840 RepID=UPI003741FD52
MACSRFQERFDLQVSIDDILSTTSVPKSPTMSTSSSLESTESGSSTKSSSNNKLKRLLGTIRRSSSSRPAPPPKSCLHLLVFTAIYAHVYKRTTFNHATS